MSQIDLFGQETPLVELDLGPIQKLLAERERQYIEPLTPREAGAIIHAHRGKHDETTFCEYCLPDGLAALERLRNRIPLEERGSGPDRGPQGSSVRADAGARSSSGTDTGRKPEAKAGGNRLSHLEDQRPRLQAPVAAPLPLPDPSRDRRGFAHAGAGDTERHSARRVMPNTGTARARVLQLLARARDYGKTDEELSIELGIRLYTAAPRRKELLDDGWICDSGRRRKTTTGSPAIVWTLTPEARADRRILELLRAAA